MRTWATRAALTLSSAAVREPTLLFVSERSFTDKKCCLHKNFSSFTFPGYFFKTFSIYFSIWLLFLLNKDPRIDYIRHIKDFLCFSSTYLSFSANFASTKKKRVDSIIDCLYLLWRNFWYINPYKQSGIYWKMEVSAGFFFVKLAYFLVLVFKVFKAKILDIPLLQNWTWLKSQRIFCYHIKDNSDLIGYSKCC